MLAKRCANSYNQYEAVLSLDWLFDALYPRKCALCQCLADESPCVSCFGEFRPADPWYRAFDKGPLAYRAVLFRYEGRAGQAVRALKYRRSTSLVAKMSALIAESVGRLGEDPEIVIPVPIHWSRRCMRGFNQSGLLCEALPRQLVHPECLTRIKATRPQVGLSHEERLTNLQGAFASRGVEGKRVLLIDDVLTSGQTAHECASTLLGAGASEVGFLAFAGKA